jgi:hypothetical protein
MAAGIAGGAFMCNQVPVARADSLYDKVAALASGA